VRNKGLRFTSTTIILLVNIFFSYSMPGYHLLIFDLRTKILIQKQKLSVQRFLRGISYLAEVVSPAFPPRNKLPCVSPPRQKLSVQRFLRGISYLAFPPRNKLPCLESVDEKRRTVMLSESGHKKNEKTLFDP
ncbi:hypothetical protein L9F63_013427, partial [Diploptera punctata]